MLHVASGREWRGGQRQVQLLARGLAASPAIDVCVMTGRDTVLAERLRADGVAVQQVTWRAGLDPRTLWSLMRQLDRDMVVHAHDSHAHALADLAARWHGTPLVVTRRAMQPLRHARRYRRASAVIAISRAVAERVADAGVDRSRVHIIPDGVDLDACQLLQQSAAPATVVCLAALQQEKGIDVLLDAAAIVHRTHPDARWIVLGEGPLRASLESRRDALGLHDIVALPGFATDATDVLARATLAVQPSRREALGSAVLEALALGVPVVASDVGGLPDALAAGGGVLVPVDAPGELASAVQRLLSDGVHRQQLARAARDAAPMFGITRMVERTLDVYRSIRIQPGTR